MKVYKEKKREFIVKIVSIMKTIRFAMNKSFCLRTKNNKIVSFTFPNSLTSGLTKLSTLVPLECAFFALI